MAALILLLSLVSMAAGGVSNRYPGIFYGVDKGGFDMPGMPITLDSGSTERDCQALCFNRKTCKYFAYKPPHCEGAQALCWLKYDKPTSYIRHRCRDVGPQDEEFGYDHVTISDYGDIKIRVDRAFADLPEMPLRLDPGSDYTDCALLCKLRPQCKSWAANLCGHECWLKNGVPRESANNCRVVGLKQPE